MVSTFKAFGLTVPPIVFRVKMMIEFAVTRASATTTGVAPLAATVPPPARIEATTAPPSSTGIRALPVCAGKLVIFWPGWTVMPRLLFRRKLSRIGAGCNGCYGRWCRWLGVGRLRCPAHVGRERAHQGAADRGKGLRAGLADRMTAYCKARA